MKSDVSIGCRFSRKSFQSSLGKENIPYCIFQNTYITCFLDTKSSAIFSFFPANILGIQVHLFMIKSFFCKKRSFFSIDRNTLSENEIPHQAILINLNKYNDRLIFQCFSETIVSLNMISKWP